ncbi:Type 1 glutamine amidotransferase-like domain-containing protein [Halotia branconii]|uniref:Type 1 glutamine amidotransferase-like domain-containing protein n=1 Tax=Halotia branconii CENA392 TaxID=1539056 RepID=A0AAJ6NY12_9CYAN|nr:Type 1 glutamine amidotransferase-like domain-containing protein [Halotia branconii]WGV28553.1 Type 1 glutamine amidotransferase-like domain-containing protein [Halotia branconii CENA392]
MTTSLVAKQIIAMGGGGFSMEPDNTLLDLYILRLCKKKTPKVCFIPTASGDSDKYIVKFYSAFGQLLCKPSHLSLFNPHTSDLRSFIFEQDIIYVGGGNTKNLIALWKEWELDHVLREAWESGVILCGLSAGSICWFEEGVTDSIPGNMTVLKCLGFLKGSNCPHYDGEAERRPVYHQLLSQGLISEGYATDDGVGLHFIGNQLKTIVSSRPQAKAYRLERIDQTVKEITLEPTYLGKK